VGCCEDGDEPLGSIKYGEFLNRSATTSFSRVALLPGGKSHFMSNNKLFECYAALRKTDSINTLVAALSLNFSEGQMKTDYFYKFKKIDTTHGQCI
jgi:hypothetical protein